MITTIKEFLLYEATTQITVNRNLDKRIDKLRAINKSLLMKEVIEGNLIIDQYFDFNDIDVKVKTINGNVTIKLNHIPLWLKNVTVNGNFYCYNNKLTSLEGCPQTVNGSFDCYKNKLTSLIGCPKTVNGYFYCANNKLTSLEGCPQTVNGYFDCYNNKLTSLIGCPKTVNGYFDCRNNKKEFSLDEINKLCKIKGNIYN
jgi:hypothetical protein